MKILTILLAFLLLTPIAYAEITGTVNVNTAEASQLKMLYRVGDVMAQRIIDGRPYKDFADFDERVSGIGARWVECNQAYVTFDGDTTISGKVSCSTTSAPTQ